MKRIIHFVLLFLLVGCGDFLEEKSQTEVRPATVSDMEKLILGSVYFTNGTLYNTSTDLFADDFMCAEPTNSIYEERKKSQRWLFLWDRNMFDDIGSERVENIEYWASPYENIMACNVVLDYLDEMQGSDDKREYLRGEALAMRGFYYLNLVNFFGLPYTMGDPEENLGVPLKLVSGVTDDPLPRKSVAEVYRQIEQDLSDGVKLMEEHDLHITDNFRVTPLVAHGLLSRMYLYQGKWDEVKKHADIVIEEGPGLYDLPQDSLTSIYESDEVLWYGSGASSHSNDSEKEAFIASDDFVNVFSMDLDPDPGLDTLDVRGDLIGPRQNAYLKVPSIGYTDWVSGVKKTLTSRGGGFRVAEAYLNRAEVYCRKYMETGDAQMGQAALDDLNHLRWFRFKGAMAEKQLSDYPTPEELLDFCLRERRRELCGECNHRWFDIRRLGLPVEHYFFFSGEDGTTVRLEANDYRYALPIPAKVLDNNTDLIQNR